MNSFQEQLERKLNDEVEWRISEMSSLKLILHIGNMGEEKKGLLKKYSIPAFYSIWEGYVVRALEEYINMVNSMGLSFNEIHPYLITHDIDMKQGLKDGRVNLNTKVDFCREIKTYFEAPLSISTRIPTKSNVNFKVINNILVNLNLEKLDERRYKHKLTKLVKYRNDIAHGENSLLVDDDIYLELYETVIMCMDGLTDILIEGISNNKYRAS